MSVKATTKTSCCSCFGSNEEKVDKKKRFHHYKPTDVNDGFKRPALERSRHFTPDQIRDFNQVIDTQVDTKAKEEAHTAAEVYKKTEK